MFFMKLFGGQSAESLADFLVNHSRYHTMNPRHGMSSYSNICKLHTLGLRGAQLEKAREVVKMGELPELISAPIEAFKSETNGAYTVCFNGRSGGHMVLYAGEYFDTGHKSRCQCCGQPNFQAVAEGRDASCGVCKGPRVNYTPARQHRVLSQGIDDNMSRDDFLSLTLVELKQKVDLVRTFDRVCDRVRDEFIAVLDDYIVVEETVVEARQVKRLERM